MKLYLFSGLGADHRVYSKFNFNGFNVVYINWIKPNKDESINSYAKRLLPQIDSNNSIFIGVSFGGIMAIEVAKYFNPKKVIIISSVKSKNELPFYFKYKFNSSILKLFPNYLLNTSNRILNYLFSIKDKESSKLLNSIMKDSDAEFVRWAMQRVIEWNSNVLLESVIHIHGSKDRIFPIKFLESSYIVKDGGHFMVIDKANEIERIIFNEISKYSLNKG